MYLDIGRVLASSGCLTLSNIHMYMAVFRQSISLVLKHVDDKSSIICDVYVCGHWACPGKLWLLTVEAK